MILKSTSGKLVDILDSRALEFYKSEGSFYLTNIDVLDASSKAVLTSLEINRKLGSIVSESLYKASLTQKLDSKTFIERVFEASRTAVENGIEFSIKGYANKSGSGDSLIFEEKELTRVKLTKDTIDTLTGEQLSFQIKISYIPELGGICVKFARKNLARKLEKHLISVNERIAENTSSSKHNEEAIQLNTKAVATAKQSIEELKTQIARVAEVITTVDKKADTKVDKSDLAELKETTEAVKSEVNSTIETKVNEVKSLISGIENQLTDKANKSEIEDIINNKLPLIDESINEIKTTLRSSPSSENVGKIKDDVDAVKAEVVKVNNTLITKADKSELTNLATKSAVEAASKKIQEIQEQLSTIVGQATTFATKEELSNKVDAAYVDSKFNEAKTAADDSLESAKAYADYNLALKATKESVESLTAKVDTKADKSYVDGLVIEKTGNIDLSHKVDSFSVDTKRNRVFTYKQSVDGQSDSIKGNTVYRIPSMFIDDEGSLYAVSDARRSGADQDAIEIVCAKTSNLTGINFNWEFKKVIGARPTKWPDARMMDPTTLVVTHKDDNRVRDGQSVIKVLCGYWEEGNTNWASAGSSRDNWKCASIITSTDGGATWSQDYFGKEGQTLHNGAKVKGIKNWNNNIHGLLGGADNGIVVNGDTWVYGVQYTLNAGTAYAALMFSKDQGQTWELSNPLPVMTSENSVTAFDGGILLVAKSETGNRGRVAYFTKDLGQTWEPFSPLNGALTAYSGKCQSSTLAFKTVSGTEVLLTSIPQTKGSDQWARDRITIYATNKEKGEIVPVKVLKYKPAPHPDGGSVPFGGYSSLYYRRTKDGEFLFVAYEDDLGITVENITDIIPQCEIICRKSEKDFDPAELKKEIRKEISKIKPSEGFKDSHVIFAGNAAELQHTYEGSVVMDDITLPESAEDSDQFEGGLHLDPVDNTDSNGAVTIPLDVERFKNGMTYAMEYYLDPSENDYGKMYYSILSFGGDTYEGEREKMTRLEVRIAGAPKVPAINLGIGNSASNQDTSVNPVGTKNTLVIVKNESEEKIRAYHNGKLLVQTPEDNIGAAWTKASEVFDKIVIGGNGLSDDGGEDGNFVGRQCKIHIGKVALYDKPMDTFDATTLLNPERVVPGAANIDTSNLAAKSDLDQVKAKVESQTTSVNKVESDVNTLKNTVKKLEAFHADENKFLGFQSEDVIFAGPIGKLAHTYKGTIETGNIIAPNTSTESDQFVDGLKLNPSNKDDKDSAFHIELDKTRFNSGGMTVAMEYYIDPASANDFAGNYLTLLSFGNNHTWDGDATDIRPMTNLEVRARHRDDYCSINYGYSNEVHSEAKGIDTVGNKNTLVAIFNPNDDIVRVYHNNQLVNQEGPDTISTVWNKPQNFYSSITFGGNYLGQNDDDASLAGRQTIMHIGRVALYGSAKPESATNAEALLSPEVIIKGKEPQIDTSNFVKKTDITNFITKEATTDFVNKSEIENLVNKSEIENLVNKSEITNFVTKDAIPGLVGEAVLKNSTEIDTSSFAKKTDIENLTSKEEVQKMFDEYVPALDVSDFVSKEDMNSAIDAKVSAIKPAEVDTTNLVKKDELDAAISAKVEEKVSAIKPTVSAEGGSLPAVLTDFMEYLQTPPTKVFDDASVAFAGNAMDIKATYDGFKVNKIVKPEVRHESNIFEKGIHLLPSNNQDVSQSFEIGLKKEELTNGVTLAFEFYIDDNDNTDFEKMYYTLCAFGDLNKDDEGDSGNMKPLEVRFVNRANRKTLNMGMGNNKANEVEVENLNNHKNTLVVVNSAKGSPSDSESPDYVKLYFNGVEVKMPGYQWIGTSWNQPKDVYNKVIIGGNGISDDEAGSRQTCIHIGRVALYKEAKEVTGAESVEALLDAKFKPFSLGGSNVG